MASLLHEMKTDIEKGFTIDLHILMNRIAAIFPFSEKTKEQDTIQSALMAASAHGHQRTAYRDRSDRDDDQPKWKKEKSQNQEENAIRHLTNEMDKMTKAMNDFKSDLGMIKQHIFNKPVQQPPQPTQGGRQFNPRRNFPNRQGRWQGNQGGYQGPHQHQQPQSNGNQQFVGTAYRSKFGSSFKSRLLDSAEEDDSQQIAHMACVTSQPSRSD
jgi:hypothetical protein